MMLDLIMAAAFASAPLADPDCAAKALEAPATVALQGATLPFAHCGTGQPTIVFEGGFGGNLQNWATLLPMVGEFAPVFAYSRPGFRGASGTWDADADGIRTSEESARLLHELLRAAGVEPPYVLVGHSLGGLYIQKFAQLYPNDTAGLVLMDNRPATLMKRCAAQGLAECTENDLSPDWSPALKSTFLGIEKSEAVAPTPEDLGNIPVLVLTAGKVDGGVSQEFFEVFRDSQIAFARQLKNGRQKTVTNANHSSLSRAQAPETAAEIRTFWQALIRSR